MESCAVHVYQLLFLLILELERGKGLLSLEFEGMPSIVAGKKMSLGSSLAVAACSISHISWLIRKQTGRTGA